MCSDLQNRMYLYIIILCVVNRAEGRSWYTTHRGRLWIAATSKQPDREDIKHMEAFYRALGKYDDFCQAANNIGLSLNVFEALFEDLPSVC